VLPSTGRSDKRFHDSTCRVAAHRRREQEAAEREGTPVAPLAPEFEDALAAALAEPRLAAYLAHSARSNWRVAAWLLERRYPERWAPGQRSEAGAAAEHLLPAGRVNLDDLPLGSLRVVR
jgi:hypothetical protein